MPASTDTQKRFAALAASLLGESGVSLGEEGKKGFGSSALQVNGKIFAMISSAGNFVVKLPKARVEELEGSGIGRKFEPRPGRLMKEWLALKPHATKQWLLLAREARGFVEGKS